MKCIATFDLGTTAIKCAVINEDLKIVYCIENEITTYNDGEHIEQNPKEWYEVFCELSRSIFEKADEELDVTGIIMSGQMQDLICVDEKGNAIRNAILYSDQRGNLELDKIDESISKAISKKTANDLNGSIPLTKLLWLRENKKEEYERIHKILISSKDYVVGKLTDEYISDVTSLATSGMMNIQLKQYVEELNDLGINSKILPKICYSHDVVGEVNEASSKETGFAKGTKVYAGSGDAGATTLASGITKDGEININLGTSGWIASVSKGTKENVFNLSAINDNLYVNVVPILNAGSIHRWIANVVDGTDTKYKTVHNAVEKSEPNAKGLFFLPYLVGERFPVMDSNVRGCYIGVNANTTREDIIRSTLEGVAFAVKQGLEALGIKPTKVSLIGGGARETNWNQIFADVIGTDVIVYENSEFLPSMALAACVLIDQKKIESYEAFIISLIDKTKTTIYNYDKINNAIYEKAFDKFKCIYPSVSILFN